MKDSRKNTAIPISRRMFVRLLVVMLSLSIISGGTIIVGLYFKSGSFELNDMLITAFKFFSMAVPFTCVVSFFLAKAFTDPILQLLEGTKAVAEGKLDYDLKIKTGDEIEELANSFTESKAEMRSFIYTVSHDLRSPLITIQGISGLLQADLENNDREKVERDLKYIEGAIARMDSLLRDTIKFSQVGSFKNSLEYLPFGELVQEALEITQAGIEARGVEVSVANDFPVVKANRLRMVEVLVNLINNSLNNLGEQPHPKIEIGHRFDGDEAVFFVKDNGIGLDPSQHEKVFRLFYKVDRDTNGTGAGLAIVKRIIEIHGGRIWVESEMDKGCTFYSTLPSAA